MARAATSPLLVGAISPASTPAAEASGRNESESRSLQDLRSIAIGPQIDRLAWPDWLIAAAVFAAAMTLYVRTLATTLLLGDSGEFQVLYSTLGLAHPTGYPVLIPLAKLITLLVPVGDAAYRGNLVSAIFASLALALLYLLGRSLSGRRLAPLVGVTAMGLYRLFWWHAIMAEAMTPGTAMIALVLLWIVLWKRGEGSPWLLFAAGLAGGLSVGIHTVTALSAPAVLVYLGLNAIGWKKKWRAYFKALLLAGLGGLAGAALTLASFFALNALNAPSSFLNNIAPQIGSWGMTMQQFQSPWVRLVYLMGGRQFQDSMFSLPQDRVMQNVDHYFVALQHDLPAVVPALAALGLLLMFVYRRKGERYRWREALLLVGSWAAMLVYIVNYDIGDIYTYYILSYVPLIAAAAAGVGGLLDFLVFIASLLSGRATKDTAKGSQSPGWPRAVGLTLQLILVAGLLWVVVTPSASTLADSWRVRHVTFLDEMHYADYPYPVNDPGWPHEFAKTLASEVEDNAIVFTDWGTLYPVFYVTHIEQGRTGIEAHEIYPAGSDGRLQDTAVSYILANLGKRPLYFTQVDDALAQKYNFVQVDAQLPLYRLEKR
jgi:uncharacterized membrane protein YozB (DUF420 family)